MMSNRTFYITIFLVGIICIGIAYNVNAISIKHDYLDTNSDNQVSFSSATFYYAQAFTTGRSLTFIDGIYCTGIQALLFRQGLPNNVTASIRYMGTTPLGGDLVSSTVNCNGIATGSPYTWVWFNFTEPIFLTQDTAYALCLINDGWAINNFAKWRVDASSPPYTYGGMWSSTTGASWSSVAADAMFRIYGYNNTDIPIWFETTHLNCTSVLVNWTYSSDNDICTIYLDKTTYDISSPDYSLSPAFRTTLNITWNGLSCGETSFSTIRVINNTYSLVAYTYSKDTVHGDCSPTLISNIINATGSLISVTNNCETTIYANYTGNETECPPCEGDCPSFNGTYYFNYSNSNMTINVTVDYEFDNETCTFDIGEDANTSSINEDNWFYLAGTLLLDNSQFILSILIGSWLFFTAEFLKTKEIAIAWVQFAFAMPLTFLIADLMLNVNMGYIIAFVIPLLSIVFLAIAYFRK